MPSRCRFTVPVREMRIRIENKTVREYQFTDEEIALITALVRVRFHEARKFAKAANPAEAPASIAIAKDEMRIAYDIHLKIESGLREQLRVNGKRV